MLFVNFDCENIFLWFSHCILQITQPLGWPWQEKLTFGENIKDIFPFQVRHIITDLLFSGENWNTLQAVMDEEIDRLPCWRFRYMEKSRLNDQDKWISSLYYGKYKQGVHWAWSLEDQNCSHGHLDCIQSDFFENWLLKVLQFLMLHFKMTISIGKFSNETLCIFQNQELNPFW